MILLNNIDHVPGKEIVEHFGLVAASTVRCKHVGRDLAASLKNLLGGELRGYTELLEEARQEALGRLVSMATQRGANAIINIRFSTSSVAPGAAEIYVYGTAVKVR